MQRVSRSNSEPVTIVDVAREAGVSNATVSRVINNEAYVKPDTRERVYDAVNRLGYVANRQARSLRGGRTHLIGLLVRNLESGYTSEIIRGIDAELVERHYDLMLCTTHWRERGEADYVDKLTKGMVDGLLLLLPRKPEIYLQSLRQRQFPHVLIDHQGIDKAGPSVGATNWQGGFDATEYLIKLGHRRIGLITGELEMGCAVDRCNGYRAAHEAHQVEIDPQLTVIGNFHQTSGYSAAKALLALHQRPSAIFVSNDEMGFGAMEAIREQGLHIPNDLSLVSFDDIPRAAVVHPALTTVRQPLEEMGRVAAQMLFQYLENPTLADERRTLSTQLVVRQSCQEFKGTP